MTAVIENIKKKATGLNSKIIFPEGEDERIIHAAALGLKKKMLKPILVGDTNIIREKAKSLKINLKGFTLINPKESKELDIYSKEYAKIKGMGLDTSKNIVTNTLFYSAIALKLGDAEGMIGGCVYTSGDFITVSKDVIGLEKGISVPSSFFIMSLKDKKWGENGSLLYSDCSVNPNPTPEELADIAISSGTSAQKLLGWESRVAILSFSTKGSADHVDVCKVKWALEKARKKSKLKIDGELQADAALVPAVAEKKIKGKIGPVAGKANVLVFPDLDAANIAYKLTQRLAGAAAYGPILQGFKKPLSDLSRGATVEDILGVIAIISVLVKGGKKK